MHMYFPQTAAVTPQMQNPQSESFHGIISLAQFDSLISPSDYIPTCRRTSWICESTVHDNSYLANLHLTREFKMD